MKVDLLDLLSNVGDIALRRRAIWLVKNMNPKIGDKVLDIGCGDGFYLHLLSNVGMSLDLTGLDNNVKALKSAKLNLKEKKVKLIYGDVLKLPFPGNTFDKVIASEVLEHVGDEALALKQIYRVLKKGGTFVLSVPNKKYPFFWDPINWTLDRTLGIHIQSGFWAGIWNQHLRLYARGEIQSILEDKDFKKVTTTELTHYCLPFNHYMINIIARLLASRKMPTSLNLSLSKYKKASNSKTIFNIFQIIFLLDKLNDSWNGEGSSVSVVGKGVK